MPINVELDSSYCSLSVRIGSTFAARSAGASAAIMDTNISLIGAVQNTGRPRGAIRNNVSVMSLVVQPPRGA